MDAYIWAFVWGMFPFVFIGFVLGVVSTQQIKRLQERVDKLESEKVSRKTPG